MQCRSDIMRVQQKARRRSWISTGRSSSNFTAPSSCGLLDHFPIGRGHGLPPLEGGDAHSHPRPAPGRAAAMRDPGVPIMTHGQRARRREHYLTKSVRSRSQGRTWASGPACATGCLPDSPPSGTIVAGGQASGQCTLLPELADRGTTVGSTTAYPMTRHKSWALVNYRIGGANT